MMNGDVTTNVTHSATNERVKTTERASAALVN